MQVPVEDCPNCNNDGCIPHQVGEDEWEAQQCEFCYEVPWSRFNINMIIETHQKSIRTGRIDGTKFTNVKTGRLDSTKSNQSNIPKSKEEE